MGDNGIAAATIDRKAVGRKTRFLALLLLLCAAGAGAILALGEAYFRLFSDISLLGVSRDLFLLEAYGNCFGNARDAQAVCFGKKVYTDGFGFRVPRAGLAAADTGNAQAMLILGDSVAFGLGLEERDTLAAHLRRTLPSTTIYNSAVVGYDAGHYKCVVESFVPEHEGIREVYLVYCLNDLSPETGDEVVSQLAGRGQARPAAKGIVERLRPVALVSRLNVILRSRSKLFLRVKYALDDAQARYWRRVFALYSAQDKDSMETTLAPLVDIASLLKARGISFTVIICPYAYQLRRHEDRLELLTPQRKLGAFFSEHGIGFVDAMGAFERDGSHGKRCFLPFDAMHLSAEGHGLLAKLILEDRQRRGRNANHGV